MYMIMHYKTKFVFYDLALNRQLSVNLSIFLIILNAYKLIFKLFSIRKLREWNIFQFNRIVLAKLLLMKQFELL
jgi:hypothetical protein